MLSYFSEIALFIKLILKISEVLRKFILRFLKIFLSHASS